MCLNLTAEAITAVDVKIKVVLRRDRSFSCGGHYRFSAGHTPFWCRFLARLAAHFSGAFFKQE